MSNKEKPAMLTVWGRRTSSNVQALMWCIGELGLPFRRHDIGHRYGGQDTPVSYEELRGSL
jgi:glutathione S-transferase